MRSSRVIAVTMLAVGMMGISTAAPAFGTDDISENAYGTYQVAYPNIPGLTLTWTAAPCEDDRPQCARITQYTTSDTSGTGTWTADAYWGVGSWNLSAAEESSCPDGSHYDQPIVYSWDAAKGAGWRSYYFSPGTCGSDKPVSVAAPFTLTRVGPLPAGA